jgi:hypothetical protein
MNNNQLPTVDEEQRLCGQFWTWLETERKTRDGREPSDQEKIAHPSYLALRDLRRRIYGDVYPGDPY